MSQATPRPLDVPHGADAAGSTVLLVDDRRENLVALQAVLEPLAVPVMTARSADEALRLLLAEEFALILLDVQMPEMDGFEAVAAIRAAESAGGRPRVPIVALTAHAMTGDAERCLAAGMDGYLSKPLRRGALDDELRRLGLGLNEGLEKPA